MNGNNVQICITDTTGINKNIYAVEGNVKKDSNYANNTNSQKEMFENKNFPNHVLYTAIIFVLSLLLACLTFFYFADASYKLCETEQCLRIAASIKASMNASADPCDDFYNYVCGNWKKNHFPMCPSTFSEHYNGWFTEKDNEVNRKIKTLLSNKDAQKNQPWAIKQAQTLYQSCKDLKSWDFKGLQPIYSLLQEMKMPEAPAGLTNKTSNFFTQYANVKRVLNTDVLFHCFVHEDFKDRRKRVIIIDRPAIGTPFPTAKNGYKGVSYYPTNTMSFLPEIEDFMWLDSRLSERSREYLVKSYMKAVISHVATNGTDDLLVNQHGRSFRISVDEKSLNRTVSTIFDVLKKLGELSRSVHSDGWQYVWAHADRYYIKVSTLQKICDSHVKSKNASLTPKLKWDVFLREVFKDVDGFHPEQRVFSSNLDWLKNVSYFVASTDEKDLETYLWWCIVRYTVPLSHSQLRGKYNDLVRALVSNLDERNCKSSFTCVHEVKNTMDMAVTRMYVESAGIDVEEKPKVEKMLSNIKATFKEYVKRQRWMDAFTRNATLKKADKMSSLINYPDWILDDKRLNKYFQGYDMDKETHFDNLVKIIKTSNHKNLQEIMTPVHQHERWYISPVTINAIHMYPEVRITLPKTILEFPYYELGLEYLNYGAIGGIIGHEFIHGFDNTGRLFDINGQLKSWWSNGTIANYTKKADCFIKQYSRYHQQEVNAHVDGTRTLNENIADNGGLRQGYKAYQMYKKQMKKELSLPGFEHFSHEQMFFLAYSHMWCSTWTPYGLKAMMRDSHSPSHVRVQGTLQNMKKFSDAWKCPVGSRMNPAEKCKLW